MRTTTPNEGHFAATYPPGSKEFFQEARANEIMGSLLAARRLLSRRRWEPGLPALPSSQRTRMRGSG
jgi:hypothetical protein